MKRVFLLVGLLAGGRLAWADVGAGVIFPFSDRTYLSTGLVYERFFNCNDAQYGDCSQVYPEIGFAFTY